MMLADSIFGRSGFSVQSTGLKLKTVLSKVISLLVPATATPSVVKLVVIDTVPPAGPELLPISTCTVATTGVAVGVSDGVAVGVFVAAAIGVSVGATGVSVGVSVGVAVGSGAVTVTAPSAPTTGLMDALLGLTAVVLPLTKGYT